MIFVTVGTHEQAFNRLVKHIDDLKRDGFIKEEVIIQTGFSTYEPMYCTHSKLFSYQLMIKNVSDARIVITHGGPSSFIMPMQIGKIPIVVPRLKQFGEHVNNHQLEFSKAVEERQGNIIVVENIDEIGNIIGSYNDIVERMPKEMQSNNKKFNNELQCIVTEMFRR